MKRHVITGLCLLAAFGCYLVGFREGVWVVIGVGLVFELVFWARLFRVGKASSR